jgi:hypothetical protein
LRRWSAAPDHISADGRLCDVDPEHQQFTVDTRRAPQRILTVHAPDQRSDLGIDPWAAADVAGLPEPVGAEAASMPTDHSFWLNDDDRVEERRVQSIQPHHHQAIDVPQSQTFRALSAEDYELLAQDEDSRPQAALAAKIATE